MDKSTDSIEIKEWNTDEKKDDAYGEEGFNEEHKEPKE